MASVVGASSIVRVDRFASFPSCSFTVPLILGALVPLSIALVVFTQNDAPSVDETTQLLTPSSPFPSVQPLDTGLYHSKRRNSLLTTGAVSSNDPAQYALRPTDLGIPETKVEARMRFSVFSLANTVIGGGILSLPQAFKLSGMATAIVALTAIFGLSLYSLRVLMTCAEYTEIARKCFGKNGVLFTDICMILSCFGVICSYVIIISDSISPLILLSEPDISEENLRIVILCCAMAVLTPLSCIRYLNALRFTSIMAIVAVCFAVLAIIIRSCQALVGGTLYDCSTKPEGCIVWFNASSEILTAIPIISFAFTCQMNFFGTYSELAQPSPRRMGKVAFRALFICLVIYELAGLFGYLEFRSLTFGNILLNHDPSDPLFAVARIAIALEILFGFPLTAHPCIATVDGLLFGDKPFSWVRKITETVCMCSLGLLIAIFVTDVSFIFALTGATASTCICFILPGAFLVRLSPQQGFVNWERGGALALTVLGVIVMISSTVVTIVDA